MIDMRCEYLYLQWILLYVFVVSPMNFRLNLQYLVFSMLSISLLERRAKFDLYVTAIPLESTTI